MPIITLTSDWGQRDYFLGAVKGKILNLLPSVTIIDISHDISPFNLKQASFIIRNSYPHFPEGTVILPLNTTGSISSGPTTGFSPLSSNIILKKSLAYLLQTKKVVPKSLPVTVSWNLPSIWLRGTH